MTFTLHPQLQQDSTTLGEFSLCRALLMRDDSVPWIILVPQQTGVRELHHLPSEAQQQFLRESQFTCRVLETLFKPDKLNLGALGNMVPQLHIHHVARFVSDIAWPGPIWGNAAGRFRDAKAQQQLENQISDALLKLAATEFTPR